MRALAVLLAFWAACGAGLGLLLPPAPLWTQAVPPEMAAGGAWAVSPDGRVLVTLSHSATVGKLRVAEGETGNYVRGASFDWPTADWLLGERNPRYPATLAVNDAGDAALLFIGYGPALAVGLTEGAETRRFPPDLRTPPADAAAFLDRNVALVRTGEIRASERTVSAWDFRNDKIRWFVRDARAFAGTRDGQRVALCETPRGRIRLRDGKTGAELGECKELPDLPPDQVELEFAPVGNALLVRQGNSVWELDDASAALRRKLDAEPAAAGGDPQWTALPDSDAWHGAVSKPVRAPAYHWRQFTEVGKLDPLHWRTVRLAPHGAAEPRHELTLWCGADDPPRVLGNRAGTHLGVVGRDRRGTPTIAWHALPPQRNWPLAGLLAIAPAGLFGWIALRRGWLRLGPTPEELVR